MPPEFQPDPRLVSSDAGITILEIMIVLVILSLVAVVGTIQVTQMMDRAKVDVATLQLRQIETSLEFFHLDMKRYPTADEGLDVLLVAKDKQADWRGPYLKNASMLVDPWGEKVRYEVPLAGSFSLVSTGSDRAEGGSGAAGDIEVGPKS